MKLKYILPVATIASVAAAITPLAVSCGAKSTCSWKKGEEYKPMTPKEAKEYKDNNELTKAYQADVKANKKIYADDMVNWLSKHATDVGASYNKISYTVNKVGEIENTNENAGLNVQFRLDLQIVLDGTVPYSDKNEDKNVKLDNTKVTITGMPFGCWLHGEENGFYTEINLISKESVLADTTWRINMPEIEDNDGVISLKSTFREYDNEDVIEAMTDDQLLFNFMAFFMEHICQCDESNYYSKATRSEL